MSLKQTLLIEQENLAHTQWRGDAGVALSDGQIALRIDRFALTANNITYAAFGEAMKYWQFYPAGDAHGILPVWGFATVSQSARADLLVGERVYGFFPFASEVVLTPDRVTAKGFAEAAPHRAELAAVYNQYVRCAADDFYQADNEAVQCLLRPLFITSWLIDDFFADHQDFGATTLLLSSASSKTAYGTAFMLAQRAKATGLRVVGLTSASNLAFVRALGCYDLVLTYDQVEQLEADEPCAYIDFAGNAALRKTIHTRFAALRYSCSVGGTHVTEIGGARDLPGPRATLFFAPSQLKKRAGDWGGQVLNASLVAAWRQFAAHVTHASPPWLSVQTHVGFDAARACYAKLLAGKSDALAGHVIEL